MKKRIIALFCALALLLPTIPQAFAATYEDVPEGTSEERIIDIITKLGVMVGYEDNGVRTFQPSAAITRAEFVTVMHNCIKLWSNAGSGTSDAENALLAEILGFNWNEFAYGSDPDLVLMYPEGTSGDGEAVATQKYLWSDVTDEHWAYSYMRDMSLLGTIHGYPDGTFRPEDTVSYNQAVKIILSLCGYDEYAQSTGGYPNGYTQLAARFGMNKGITASGEEPLSRMEAATLVYNSFKVKLVSPLISSDETKTFLNDIMGVYLLEGTLEATDITSIYDGAANKSNIATVDGVDFKFDDESDIRSYIGQEIRVFLTKVDDEYIMKTFEATGGDDITEIDISLFENYASRTFYYKKSEDSKESSVKVRIGSVLIYNGKYMPEYDSSTFEDLNRGSITVIEKDDLEYDIIVVENYESGYMSSINVRSMELIDKVATARGASSVIKLKSNDAEAPIIYELYDANGDEIDFESLKAGAINYYTNDNYVKLYCGGEKVSGKVVGMRTEDGVKTVTIGDNAYDISKHYLAAGGDTRNGLSITAYLDSFGEIVWIENDSESIDGYVYVIKSRRDFENSNLIVKYYDISQKAVLEATTVEEVKFTDRYGSNSTYDMEVLYEQLGSYDGILKLSFNSDGKIAKIVMPLDKDVDSGTDKMKLVLETSENASSSNYMENYIFLNGALSGKYYTDSSTSIVRIPLNREDYDKYSVMASNTVLGWTTTTLCKLYAFDAEAPFMNIVLLYSLSADSTTTKTTTYSGFVTGIVQSINEDNELTTEVSLFTSSGETVRVSALQDEDGKSLFEKAGGAYVDKDTVTYKVSKGDYIKISTDSVNGEVNDVQLVYDADGVNPAWCQKDAENKPTSCPDDHTHNTKIKGCFTGGNGYVHTKENTSLGNPLGYSNTSWTAAGYNTGRFQLVPGNVDVSNIWTFGFVHSVKDGLFRITTQNLKEGFTGKEDDNFYWTYDKPDTATVWIYEDGEFTRGTTDDVRTWEQVGSDCDKVLILNGGSMRYVYILRD